MKIKTWMLAAMLVVASAAHGATNDLTGLLQKGLFEEEANRDLTAAIANYQSLASAFDKDRQLAATAIFRLGECYRKLGKTNEAVVQYQRIIKEFGDQQTLATLSQQNLAGLRSGPGAVSGNSSLDDLHLAVIKAQRLVRSVDGTIEAAHGTNRGPVLISLFHDDKAIQILADDQEVLRNRFIKLTAKPGADSPEIRSLKEQIQARQKAMEDRADELAAAAHSSLDLAEEAYRQKLVETTSGTSPSADSAYNSEVAQVEATAESLQVQIDEIAKMPPDRARIYVQQNFPNPVLTSLIEQLNGEEMQLMRNTNSYSIDHPALKPAREQIESLKQKIDLQIEGVLDGLRSKFAVAEVQRDLLHRRQSEMTGTTGGGGGGSQDSVTTDEEQNQIRRIQLMIQNSPDLINAAVGDSTGNRTPLQGAAERGQLTVAKYLLDHGADVNGRSPNGGAVPLLAAAENGHKSMVELLLAHGADVNGKGLNPLYEAVAHGFTGVAEILIAGKADVNLPCGTAMGGRRALHAAVRSGKPELIQLLLSHGADVNATDDQGQTPLAYAVDYAGLQDPIAAAKMLLAAKASVEAKDKKGNTALHGAAQSGNAAMVSLLLDSGAMVDSINLDDATPLLLAVVTKKADAVRVLLEHKADPDREGWGPNGPNSVTRSVPVDFAIWNESNEILKLLLDAGAKPDGDQTARIPLFAALDRNAVDAIKILLDYKADPNHIEKGFPALNYALRAGRDARTIALLLDHGADANARDSEDLPALFRTGNPEIARLLLAHNADANARIKDGLTPLMRLVNDTNYDKELFQNKANPDLQDTNGNTALHWAVYYPRPGQAGALLEGKANPNIQNNQGYTPLDLAKSGADGQIPEGMFMASYGQKNLNSTEEKKTEQKLVDLLVNSGGLANLPKRDRIEVRRASNSPLTFTKEAKGRNQLSLLETIACSYGLLSLNLSGQWETSQRAKAELFGQELRFPDFKKVVIYRRTDTSPKQTVINVDVEDILKTGDCSRNVWLQWGDVVEIPEADHPVNDQWQGLSGEDANALIKCVTRQVTLKIKGENTALTLAPRFVESPSMSSAFEHKWGKTRASFMLRSVLDNSKLIRVSSDLAHVKVTRTDPATKKTTEWIIDCADYNQPGLWLRDGDVIEVPEK